MIRLSKKREMGSMESYRGSVRLIFSGYFLLLAFASISVPRAQGWSKEGHILTCQIAQGLLEAVKSLLPEYAEGDLSSLCTWPDQIRHWMCVAGAIQNYTSQLSHYAEGTSGSPYNLTEALLFLSHFVGDIHQPMHVGFTSDEGGNTIELRWFRHKSNLHHVWDREIILTALADYYDKDMSLLLQDIVANFTDGIWSDDVSSWKRCNNVQLRTCVNKYAVESIKLACEYGYEGVEAGQTLSDDYFNSRLPIVMKRIAQGGIRLAMILNRVFSDSQRGLALPI
ncbi:hypothetical protein FEM48_Zijuj01G0146800 [Ziziphus jujuba var. spinosa]|uniref:Aspergillus nuclease S1 n=1 Tax=Ziziphus jujuba var. spinosa TaxID=714518 RepID=A0A978W1V0_ZIZJJ|nr:hypothetical protein FEM48_Zijuj01G0146800 [Ziziphus jujuba var. spinosa]